MMLHYNQCEKHRDKIRAVSGGNKDGTQRDKIRAVSGGNKDGTQWDKIRAVSGGNKDGTQQPTAVEPLFSVFRLP